ncbi:MAG: hypothetical protein ABIH22_00425 [Candidatus Margulisiibacteriota bacterium]
MKSWIKVLVLSLVAVLLLTGPSFAARIKFAPKPRIVSPITKPEEKSKDYAVIYGTFFYNGVPTAAKVGILQLTKKWIPLIGGMDKKIWTPDGTYEIPVTKDENYSIYAWSSPKPDSLGLGPEATGDIKAKDKKNKLDLEFVGKRTIIARAFRKGVPAEFSFFVYELDKQGKPISNKPIFFEHKSKKEHQVELTMLANYSAVAREAVYHDYDTPLDQIPTPEDLHNIFYLESDKEPLYLDFNFID